MTKRANLAVTIGVALAKKGTKEERLPIAIEEWLDGNKWAGKLFDENDWDFRLFVLEVKKIFKRHERKTTNAI